MTVVVDPLAAFGLAAAAVADASLPDAVFSALINVSRYAVHGRGWFRPQDVGPGDWHPQEVFAGGAEAALTAYVASPDALRPGPVCDALPWDEPSRVAGLLGVDPGPPVRWGSDPVAVLEAGERVKAWVDAVVLGAIADLARTELDDVLANPMAAAAAGQVLGGEVTRARLEEYLGRMADASLCHELMAATGIGMREIDRRIALATDRTAGSSFLHEQLGMGTISLDRALRVHDTTREMPAQVADGVARRVLAPMKDGSVPSARQLAARLARQSALHPTMDLEQARAEGLRRRCATADMSATGIGHFTCSGASADVTAAMNRVDAMARQVKAAGEANGRTLSQLRSDVALALLMRGQLPSSAEDASQWTRVIGEAPPAHVQIVVSLSTLLGVDDGLGEIPGHGYLTAVQTREAALVAGSVWQRLVADPTDGHLVEASSARYVPTEAMRRFARARDVVCRGPGCTVPAASCDLDHQVPWPDGATTVDNLNHKHRRHHDFKTLGLWQSEQGEGGTVVWTTPAGRTYTTYPHEYLDADGTPIAHDARPRSAPERSYARHVRASTRQSAGAESAPTRCTDPPPF